MLPFDLHAVRAPGRHRPRIQYMYPPSPTSSSGRSSPELVHVASVAHHHRHTHGVSLATRLANLKAELSALENELGDQKEGSPGFEDDEEPVVVGEETAADDKPKKHAHGHGHVEPGELIKEVVDVKARLEKIGKLKEGRTGREKLVSAVLQGAGEQVSTAGKSDIGYEREEKEDVAKDDKEKESVPLKLEARDIADMDRRLGELERAVGSSSTSVDEVRPMHCYEHVGCLTIRDFRAHLSHHLCSRFSLVSTPSSLSLHNPAILTTYPVG